METYGLEQLGILNPKAVYRNLEPAQLVEHALRRGEGQLSNTGALCVRTGKYTGRSPNDKFIVDSEGVHDDIAWGKINVPTTQAVFDALYEKMVAYLQNREIFVFDGFAGADSRHTASSTSWPARISLSTSFCCVPRRSSLRTTRLTSPSSVSPASSAIPSGTTRIPRRPS